MAEPVLLPLTEALVARVARSMRVADRREVFATRFDDDPDALARDLVAMSRFGAVAATGSATEAATGAATGGEPVAAMGAVECWPGVWNAWMIATDRWPLVARAATRWARLAVLSVLVEAGAHRCECKSIEGHDAAHRWLRHLGAEAEAMHRGFGRNGENFITFAWRFDHVRCVPGQQTESAAPAAAHRR